MSVFVCNDLATELHYSVTNNLRDTGWLYMLRLKEFVITLLSFTVSFLPKIMKIGSCVKGIAGQSEHALFPHFSKLGIFDKTE